MDKFGAHSEKLKWAPHPQKNPEKSPKSKKYIFTEVHKKKIVIGPKIAFESKILLELHPIYIQINKNKTRIDIN